MTKKCYYSNTSYLILKTFTLETVWDTKRENTTTEILYVGLQKSGSSYFYNGQFTWSNMDIDEISGNIEKNPGKFLSTLSILHNNERQFGFDMTIVSEIGQGVSKVYWNKKYRITIIAKSW